MLAKPEVPRKIKAPDAKKRARQGEAGGSCPMLLTSQAQERGHWCSPQSHSQAGGSICLLLPLFSFLHSHPGICLSVSPGDTKPDSISHAGTGPGYQSMFAERINETWRVFWTEAINLWLEVPLSDLCHQIVTYSVLLKKPNNT